MKLFKLSFIAKSTTLSASLLASICYSASFEAVKEAECQQWSSSNPWTIGEQYLDSNNGLTN